MYSKICNSLGKDIKFYKAQIIYYQTLLQETTDKLYGPAPRSSQKYVLPICRDSEIVNNENDYRNSHLDNSRRKRYSGSTEFPRKKGAKRGDVLFKNQTPSKKEILRAAKRRFKDKKRKYCSKKESDKEKDNEEINENDIYRVRMRQLDARKGLDENEEDISKIREYEKELIKDGESPFDAQMKARKRYYPKSLPKKQIVKESELEESELEDSDSDNKHISDNSEDQEDRVKNRLDVESELHSILDNSIRIDNIEKVYMDGNSENPENILDEVELMRIHSD